MAVEVKSTYEVVNNSIEDDALINYRNKVMYLKSFIMRKSEETDRGKVEINDLDKNVLKMNFKDKNFFNYIVMRNPNDSKFLYVINEIKVDLEKSNRCCVIPEENNYISIDKDNEELNIVCEYDEDKNNSLLKSYMEDTQENYNLFDKHFAILIPGGSLKIKLEDAVEEAFLKVCCTKEKI